MNRLICSAVMCGVLAGAGAQVPLRTLQFSQDRNGAVAVAQYTLVVAEDGAGVYVGKVVNGPVTISGQGGDGKAIHVDAAVVKKLFDAVPMVEGGRCETHSKGLAKMGLKTLRYLGAGREAQCAYNYSDDDRVNAATTTFEAVAETMQYGERLQAKLRFDRLGLDAELDGLQSALDQGRALAVGNIAPVLQQISDDERVMDRVHRKAARLLQGVAAAQPGGPAVPSER